MKTNQSAIITEESEKVQLKINARAENSNSNNNTPKTNKNNGHNVTTNESEEQLSLLQVTVEDIRVGPFHQPSQVEFTFTGAPNTEFLIHAFLTRFYCG